jgi:hypothetical protein
VTTRFALDPAVPYRELRDPPLPAEVRALALACFAAQRRALPATHGDPSLQNGGARPDAACAAREPAQVSADALHELLASGARVGGIVGQREVATAIPFNQRLARDVVQSREVASHRRRLDRAIARWLGTLFDPSRPPLLRGAGQWWYPPGTFFGWHTNDSYPGWRLYLSHAEEPGRSFFRYRHPTSGEIVTSPDGAWDLRCFVISAEQPLWHAIASDTHRFSVGWHVRPWSLRDALAQRLERLRAL